MSTADQISSTAESEDKQYKFILTAAMLTVAAILLPVYVYRAYQFGNQVDFYANLLAFIAVIFGVIALTRHRWQALYSICALIGMLIYFSSLYAATSSGNPMDLLWCTLVIPGIAVAIGYRVALPLLCLMVVVSYIGLYLINLPELNNLSANVKGNYLVVLIVMCGLSLVIDRQRYKVLLDLSKERSKLAWLSSHDHLTGLINRRGITNIINRSDDSRNVDKDGILLLDIDNFKSINDSFGHSIGDQALRQVANFIAKQNRPQDKAARWGGDEFLVYLPDTDKQTTLDIATNLCQKISKVPIDVGSEPMTLEISCGVASMSDRDTLDSIIERADKRLYIAKRSNDNVVSMG
jgi:diguanylate cyclase (GGDEF)-like protein